MTLKSLECEACRADAPKVGAEQARQWLDELSGWTLVAVDGVEQLHKGFAFRNFSEALAFTQRVGEMADAVGHHPALITEWGKTTVQWWTHKIRGLHQNDFILASRTDDLFHD